MSYILVLFTSFFSAAILDHLPVRARVIAMHKEMAASLAVLQAEALSDDEKQKRLLAISFRLLVLTAQLALLLGLVVLPFVVVTIMEKYWRTDPSFTAMLLTVRGMTLCTAGFLFYFPFKKVYEHFRL
jgi:hypothetical protein